MRKSNHSLPFWRIFDEVCCLPRAVPLFLPLLQAGPSPTTHRWVCGRGSACLNPVLCSDVEYPPTSTLLLFGERLLLFTRSHFLYAPPNFFFILLPSHGLFTSYCFSSFQWDSYHFFVGRDDLSLGQKSRGRPQRSSASHQLFCVCSMAVVTSFVSLLCSSSFALTLFA